MLLRFQDPECERPTPDEKFLDPIQRFHLPAMVEIIAKSGFRDQKGGKYYRHGETLNSKSERWNRSSFVPALVGKV